MEVMVAALLLLVVMAGFLPLFLGGLNQSSTVRQKSLATNIARERMEEVRQLDYREIVDASTLATRFGTSKTVRSTSFTIDYSVATMAYDTGQLKEVSVRVSWNAPPKVSAALITSLIHQQFVGPRGAMLEFVPAGTIDPLGTPFGVLAPTETMRYHLAEADWSLVYDNLNQPGETLKNIYMRLWFVDDSGSAVPIGPGTDDKKIDKSYIVRVPSTGPATDIYFEYPSFSTSQIPDGYWEARAIAYNQYDEPGNMWRLRVRVENSAPEMVTNFKAQGQETNQDVVLTWTPGAERDRSHWVVERQKRDPITGMWPAADGWTTLSSDLDPIAATYTDKGDVPAQQDPWGDAVTTNLYRYRVFAIDIAGKMGDVATPAEAQLPPLATTTTTYPVSTTATTTPTPTSSTTTTTQSATTTTGATTWTVRLRNTTNKAYSVTIKNSASAVVWSGSLAKGSSANPTIVTTGGMPAGSYSITATSSGRPDLTPSFTLSAQAGAIVLDIL